MKNIKVGDLVYLIDNCGLPNTEINDLCLVININDYFATYSDFSIINVWLNYEIKPLFIYRVELIQSLE